MKVKSFFALVGVVAIPVTIVLTTGWNPLTWVGNKVTSARTLADPPTAWQASVGNNPDWARPAGPEVLAVGGDQLVTAIDMGTGDRRWWGQAEYSAVAGGGGSAAAVVIMGDVAYPDGHRSALEARDPYTGVVLWSDPDAIGAWTYTNLVITLSCPKSAGCGLTARQPRSGTKVWTASLPAGARTLHGGNHALAVLRPLVAGALGPAPQVLGFPVDNTVHLLRTDTGAQLSAPQSSPASRVVAAGDGMLRVQADLRAGVCRYTLAYTGLVGAKQTWSTADYQPRAGGGGACEQSDDPRGDAGLLYVAAAGNRDALLRLDTGKLVGAAADGETILAVSAAGDQELVRTADKKAVVVRSVAGGGEVWRQAITSAVTVGTDRATVTFVDPENGTIAARNFTDGRLLIQADSLSTLLGYTPAGLVLNETLRVGVLRFGSVHA